MGREELRRYRGGMNEAEMDRLSRRHSDIRLHGAGALAREAARHEAQAQLVEFVLEHNLACFKCGTRLNTWAKTGYRRGRAWAICTMCVRRKAPLKKEGSRPE